jgi:hypothetical protein
MKIAGRKDLRGPTGVIATPTVPGQVAVFVYLPILPLLTRTPSVDIWGLRRILMPRVDGGFVRFPLLVAYERLELHGPLSSPDD